jgi:hypothetical protein
MLYNCDLSVPPGAPEHSLVKLLVKQKPFPVQEKVPLFAVRPMSQAFKEVLGNGQYNVKVIQYDWNFNDKQMILSDKSYLKVGERVLSKDETNELFSILRDPAIYGYIETCYRAPGYTIIFETNGITQRIH